MKKFLQVVLQTYIEDLRGKIEEKKEMNHHGKTVVVNTATKIAPVEYEIFLIQNIILLLFSGRLGFALSMSRFKEMR